MPPPVTSGTCLNVTPTTSPRTLRGSSACSSPAGATVKLRRCFGTYSPGSARSGSRPCHFPSNDSYPMRGVELCCLSRHGIRARWNRTTDLSIISAGQGLVRQLVYPLTCQFVPRRATKRRVVPLRLGTLWARPEVDMTRLLAQHRPFINGAFVRMSQSERYCLSNPRLPNSR